MRALSAGIAYIKGAALSVWRYHHAHKEIAKISRVNSALDAAALKNLIAYPDRNAMLAAMPKGGTAVEIGVAEGNFSRQIVDIMQPDELLLIDYWKTGKQGHGKAVSPLKQGGRSICQIFLGAGQRDHGKRDRCEKGVLDPRLVLGGDRQA